MVLYEGNKSKNVLDPVRTAIVIDRRAQTKEAAAFTWLLGNKVLAVAYIVWLQFGMGGWFRGYSYRCQPVDYSQNPMAIRVRLRSRWLLPHSHFLSILTFGHLVASVCPSHLREG